MRGEYYQTSASDKYNLILASFQEISSRSKENGYAKEKIRIWNWLVFVSTGMQTLPNVMILNLEIDKLDSQKMRQLAYATLGRNSLVLKNITLLVAKDLETPRTEAAAS